MGILAFLLTCPLQMIGMSSFESRVLSIHLEMVFRWYPVAMLAPLMDQHLVPFSSYILTLLPGISYTFFVFVVAAGIEPVACSLGGNRSIQLSYATGWPVTWAVRVLSS